MKMQWSRITNRINHIFGGDVVHVRNIQLPAKHLRLCGSEFEDDEHFIDTAISEAERLTENFDFNLGSRILDVGCGPGRLAIGILNHVGEVEHYQGIDIVRKRIQWCQRYIGGRHSNFHFTHMDTHNSRYNPGGQVMGADFRFPLSDEKFDIIYLYSVFSHMISDEVQLYLREFQRLLTSSGKIFLTAFVENSVPDVSVNPDDYMRTWKGPLHCVRYETDFFAAMLGEHGFQIDYMKRDLLADGQNCLYISRSS